MTAHLLVSARQLIFHGDEPPAAVLLELDELLPGGESEAEGAAVGGPGGPARCSPRLEVPLVFSAKKISIRYRARIFKCLWGPGIESKECPASLCSLAGRYDNPVPPRFLAPMDFIKVPALERKDWKRQVNNRRNGWPFSSLISWLFFPFQTKYPPFVYQAPSLEVINKFAVFLSYINQISSNCLPSPNSRNHLIVGCFPFLNKTNIL